MNSMIWEKWGWRWLCEGARGAWTCIQWQLPLYAGWSRLQSTPQVRFANRMFIWVFAEQSADDFENNWSAKIAGWASGYGLPETMLCRDFSTFSAARTVFFSSVILLIPNFVHPNSFMDSPHWSSTVKIKSDFKWKLLKNISIWKSTISEWFWNTFLSGMFSINGLYWILILSLWISVRCK